MVSKSINDLCIKIRNNPSIQTIKILDIVFPTGNHEDNNHILETLRDLVSRSIDEIYRFTDMNYDHLTHPKHLSLASNGFLLEVCWWLSILKYHQPGVDVEPMVQKIARYLAINLPLNLMKDALNHCEQTLESKEIVHVFPIVFLEIILTQRPDVIDMLKNDQQPFWDLVKSCLFAPPVKKSVPMRGQYLDASQYKPMISSTRFPITHALYVDRRLKEPLYKKDEPVIEAKEEIVINNNNNKTEQEVTTDENRSPNLPPSVSLIN